MPAQDLLTNKNLLKTLGLGNALTDEEGGVEALLKTLVTAASGSGNPYLTALALGLPLAGGIANAFTRSPRETPEKEMRESAAEKAKNGSSAKDAQEKEAATEEADPQGAIREDDEEPSPDETEDTTNPTVEEDTPLTKWR